MGPTRWSGEDTDCRSTPAGLTRTAPLPYAPPTMQITRALKQLAGRKALAGAKATGSN
jgi:hypothetical protein